MSFAPGATLVILECGLIRWPWQLTMSVKSGLNEWVCWFPPLAVARYLTALQPTRNLIYSLLILLGPTSRACAGISREWFPRQMAISTMWLVNISVFTYIIFTNVFQFSIRARLIGATSFVVLYNILDDTDSLSGLTPENKENIERFRRYWWQLKAAHQQTRRLSIISKLSRSWLLQCLRCQRLCISEIESVARKVLAGISWEWIKIASLVSKHFSYSCMDSLLQ